MPHIKTNKSMELEISTYNRYLPLWKWFYCLGVMACVAKEYPDY